MTKVWLVGISDCEGGYAQYICTSKEKALMRWEEIRIELIERAKEGLEYCKCEGLSTDTEERIISNLMSTNDPDKMNNYPQDQPYMREMELDE